MFEPGSQVGRYEIQRRLGRGGMGAVYVAHDPVLGRMVAIKVFSGDLDMPDARERFSREARAAAALSHPNIVTVFDFGELDGQPYIVMEYVPGETLAGLIKRRTPVSMADKLRWMEELCAGAGYAHQMQLVHRDIKPANLMIDRSGRLKILDFGIARMLGIASNTSVMVGTPGYMAPEQITGDPVDHRADQFSIGVVLYELLASSEAFPGDTLPMITNRILTQEPAPLNRAAPDAPPEIVTIIERALRKSAHERFPDTESMRVAIARVRREYSTNAAAWNAPTILVSRETPPPTGARGTGSARRRQDDAAAVAQMTPPPDPKRTDREALARRRAAQLDAALQEARRLLAQQQLDAALDACHQALTLDENHVDALILEGEIAAAIRLRDEAGYHPAVAVEPPAGPGGDAPTDAIPSQAISSADLEVAGAAPGAPTGAVDRTVLRMPAAPPDATIVAPPRRTPAPAVPAAPPPSAPAVGPTGPAKATSAPPKGQTARQAPARKASPPRKPAPAIGPAISALLARVREVVASADAGVLATVPPRHRRLVRMGAGVAVVAVAAVALVLVTAGPAPSGVVVIDAVPWAYITAVESEDGERVPLPSPSSTPLSLQLPAGSYQVVLTGPPPESQTQRITLQVQAGVTAAAPIQRFRALTPEEYFERYLAAPTDPIPAPTEPQAGAEGAASVPAGGAGQ